MQQAPSSRQAKKRQTDVPPALEPQVQAAVDDIMYGTNVDSQTEWLQREFQRLMKREAQYRNNSNAAIKKTSTTADS